MVRERPWIERRMAVGLAAAFLLSCCGWFAVPRCAAEETLTLASGGDFLGHDQGDGKFETCNGSIIPYDTESGDSIDSSKELCPPEGDDLPKVKIEPNGDEPPPR